MTLSSIDSQTLRAVETHGRNLNTISLDFLYREGLIYTDYTECGWKISAKGTDMLDKEDNNE